MAPSLKSSHQAAAFAGHSMYNWHQAQGCYLVISYINLLTCIAAQQCLQHYLFVT